MIVMALGMGLTMAPATESIMGSLPRAKAGVGSAINDTTRQVGGALGVAVLGSLLSSHYGPAMSDALSGVPLPADAVAVATDRVSGAIQVAQQVGGSAGDLIATAARNAFVDGMGIAVLVGAAVAFVGAVSVFLFLPARAAAPADEEAVSPGGEPQPAVEPATVPA
jgi:hypothetical protein